MPDPQVAGDQFTTEQRARLHTRVEDQDRTLHAINQLEAALAAVAFGRRVAWYAAVIAALETLDAATAEEQSNADDAASLLSDIERTQSRLRHRVRGTRAQYRQLRERISSLLGELTTGNDDIDVADLRDRLAWLLTALRHQRARESELIYEAYHEAFQRDIEDDLGSP
jgi:chromosome segregation ATPase